MYNINVNSFEEYKMILAIKGAVEEIKANPVLENAYGAFIFVTMQKLKEEYNISKEDIFKYRFNINN